MKINRNRLKTLLCAAGAILLAGYMAAAFAVGRWFSATDICRGMRIEVIEDTHRSFVTAREIARELGTLPERSDGMRLADINTERIADRLRDIDKIEEVSVVKTSDRRVLITVTPLIPVARIFDGKDSYYINKDNKRISAGARYHIDVPVISGHFEPSDTSFTPVTLLPLLNWLNDHPKWNSLATMIRVDSPHDIIIIPAISGHVVNIGEPDNLESKFERLQTFYSRVMPVKGWNYYDTISVKFAGQVVATRRVKPVVQSSLAVDEDDEDDDVTTMLAGEGVAPGQTIPGRKADNDRPIPAADRAVKRPEKPDSVTPKH